MMNKDQVIDWLFKGIIVVLGGLFLNDFTEMKDSVIRLNTQFAVLVRDVKNQKELVTQNRTEIIKLKDEIYESKLRTKRSAIRDNGNR